MTTTRISRAMFASVLAVTTAGLLGISSADARRYVKPFYSETYDFDRPVRGYEGFVFPDYYCSYKRYPKRVCTVDRHGSERCRVAGWTLEQTCQ